MRRRCKAVRLTAGDTIGSAGTMGRRVHQALIGAAIPNSNCPNRSVQCYLDGPAAPIPRERKVCTGESKEWIDGRRIDRVLGASFTDPWSRRFSAASASPGCALSAGAESDIRQSALTYSHIGICYLSCHPSRAAPMLSRRSPNPNGGPSSTCSRCPGRVGPLDERRCVAAVWR